MVGNGKLIKHTGDMNSAPIQALIGMAIKKKKLPFKYDEGLQLSQGKKSKFSLKLSQSSVEHSDPLSIKKQPKKEKVLSKHDKKLLKRKREAEDQLPICASV